MQSIFAVPGYSGFIARILSEHSLFSNPEYQGTLYGTDDIDWRKKAFQAAGRIKMSFMQIRECKT